MFLVGDNDFIAGLPVKAGGNYVDAIRDVSGQGDLI
jgi:hypothetical protein